DMTFSLQYAAAILVARIRLSMPCSVWSQGNYRQCSLAICRSADRQNRAAMMSAGQARPAAVGPFAQRTVPDRIAEAWPCRQGWYPSQDGRWQSAWRLLLDFHQTLLPRAASEVAHWLDPRRNWWRSQSAPAVG